MRLFDCTISVAKNKTALKLVREKLSEELISTLTASVGIDGDKDGPAICTGLYYANNRGSGNAIEKHEILALDIDKVVAEGELSKTDTLLKKLRRIRDDGYEFAMYSTLSHTSANPRFRLLLPLLEPVESDEYRALSKAFVKYYDLDVDEGVTFGPASLFFLPLYEQGNEESRDKFKCRMVEGKAVDLDSFDWQSHMFVSHSTLGEDDFDVFDRPIPTPTGASNEMWITAILKAYPAEELTHLGDNSYAKWFDVMLATHHHFGGSREGCEYFIDWSMSDPNNLKTGLTTKERMPHAEYVRTVKWPSIGKKEGERKMTFKALLNKERVSREMPDGKTRKVSWLAAAYGELIGGIESRDDLDMILKSTKEDMFLREKNHCLHVAGIYTEQYTYLTGKVAPEPVEVSKQIETGDVSARTITDKTADAYYDRYIRITGRSKYLFDLHTSESIEVATFNARHHHEMPPLNPRNPDSGKWLPFNIMQQGKLGYKPLREAREGGYVVNGTKLLKDRGLLVINEYVQDSWMRVVSEYSEDDEIDVKIKEYVHKHLRFVSGGEDVVAEKALLQWLAHTRQNPHERSIWGVALVSQFGGTGKTMYIDLCRAVLGKEQVKTLNSGSANSTFNGALVEPALITFVEEAKSRQGFDVDIYKEAMTNRTMTVTFKGREPITRQVHSQFAVIANQESVLGGEILARRWVPITPKRDPIRSCKRILGVDHPVEFFGEYKRLMSEYPERFAAYFDSIDLSDFDKHIAPLTKTKRSSEKESLQAEIASHIKELVASNLHVTIGVQVIHKLELKRQLTILADELLEEGDDDNLFVRYFSKQAGTGLYNKRGDSADARRKKAFELALGSLDYREPNYNDGDDSKRYPMTFGGIAKPTRKTIVFSVNTLEAMHPKLRTDIDYPVRTKMLNTELRRIAAKREREVSKGIKPSEKVAHLRLVEEFEDLSDEIEDL